MDASASRNSRISAVRMLVNQRHAARTGRIAFAPAVPRTARASCVEVAICAAISLLIGPVGPA